MNPTIEKKTEQDTWKDEIDEGRKDMQGLIARGYDSLNAACFIFLKITDAVQAKAYFNNLILNYITSAEKKTWINPTPKGDPQNAVHIAFTSSGLKELGLNVNTFSREFVEGMNTQQRSALLGDTENNNPKNWDWGNKEKEVHCVLMLYARNNTALADLEKNVFTPKSPGVQLIKRVETFEYNDKDEDKEHFGFRDGLSQPVIRGFSKSSTADDHLLVKPGEFILGYINEYDNYSPSPYVERDAKSVDLPYMPDDKNKNKKDLGKNGTYIVFRQIEQHVEKFWKFLYHNSKETAAGKTEKAIKLAAKMVGRWPEGQPLATCPDAAGMQADLLNEFNYFDPDKDGVRCPFGAHIRRTNPRDQVHTGRTQEDSVQMSQRHRMVRRGRIYGAPLDKKRNIENMIREVKDKNLEEKTKDGKTEIVRGLHFICMVSDIGRQFEFIQNVWANTSTFGDLCNEVDPMISPRPTKDQPKCHEFTTPQQIIRNRYKQVPMFTTVVGGAYFFMPGIEALKYIMK